MRKQFGTLVAVDDLSFDVAAGSIVGFLGPNGAGKSTTLRVIGGLLQPTAGHADIFGQDARRPEARRRLGYMPADPMFLPHLSGEDNLELLARLRRTECSARRHEVAARLGLTEAEMARRVDGYSSGMRQKLALVGALQHSPDLVVLDEPANRLDPVAHETFCELMREVADAGGSVLLSSHVLSEVEELCDGVVLLRAGRLLGQSTVDGLRSQASREVTLSFTGTPPQTPPWLTGVRVHDHALTGRMPAHHPELVRQLLDEPRITDVLVTPASLEDVFLDLYKAERS